MQSSLGITCHFITGSWELKSVLLSCSRHHTGDRIVSEFDDVVSAFGIQDKICDRQCI